MSSAFPREMKSWLCAGELQIYKKKKKKFKTHCFRTALV